MQARNKIVLGIVLLFLVMIALRASFPSIFRFPKSEATPTQADLRVTAPVPPTQTQPSGTPTDQNVEETNSAEGQAFRIRELDGMPEILISAGAFMMGCDPENNAGVDCMPDILPLHEVELSAYTIDQFEVNNAQYTGCVSAGKCTEPKILGNTDRPDYYLNPDYADQPVVAVDWRQADNYCRWVGGRLPTEAEWEKAARGEDLRPYPWGFEPAGCSKANFNSGTEGRCSDGTTKVGSFPEGASPYGVMDLAGNVWEWTNDWYDWTYYQTSPKIDPKGPETGYHKIVKGGAWDYSGNVMTISYNSDHAPQEYKSSFGFRCVRPVTP